MPPEKAGGRLLPYPASLLAPVEQGLVGRAGMAFWASAAWGREALGVGVETSKRLDVSVKAQLVGAYMGVCVCVCDLYF